ncbi:MAG TPA: G1 family glutamic endopeptidase [Pseudonocardiaceae bacterium]|nr:G1 family glutamic endopeptidase [Pseudonocardiaceae bacterium]
MQFSWSRAVIVVAAPLALLGMAAIPASAQQHQPAVPNHATLHHSASDLHSLAGNKDSSSDNWAGYVVDGASKSFTTVESTFTLPKVSCTGEGDTSFWVGFDGDTSDSVEQIGASGDCDGTTPDYYAWWEMYPAGVHELSNTTKPGDVFDAKVTYGGSGKYTLYLDDKTEGWTVTKNETSTSAEDNSAEVIFEAAGPTSDAVPKFSPVSMSDSTVDGTELGADSPSAIDLVRNGHTLVTPGSISSAGSFTFTWHAAS